MLRMLYSPRPTAHGPRSGITVVELLVVIAIFSILMALVLPAVMSARRAAYRAHCANNLKQIGLAVTGYETQWSVFPNGLTFKYDILPYLEIKDIQSQPGPDGSIADSIKGTVIPVYYCPSDSAPALVAGVARANYTGCSGTGVLTDGLNGVFRVWSTSQNRNYAPIGSADIHDGLSSTAAVSEILCAIDDPNAVLRVFWNTPQLYSQTSADAFAGFCESIPPKPSALGYQGLTAVRGLPWYDGNYGHGLYNHVLPPNRPSCLNQTELRTGISTASSLHHGGVNLLMADGHVRFVSVSIDRKAWREMGSRGLGAPDVP